MLAFRFANGMFEPIWNRNYIDYVQITAAEDLGIGTPRRLLRHVGRAARPGPEPHAAAAHAAVHGAAGDASPPTTCATRRSRCCTRSRRRRPRTCEMAVRAQYAAGHGRGQGGARLPRGGGRARPTRSTETYAALRLEVDNWRWAGVPIYLRTGKRLARKVTEIAVTLKPVPHLAFEPEGSVGVQPNQLVLTMQPNEGVSLSLGAKIPGSADAHPAGEHGVPLRHGVPVAVARGVRAADPGRDARRRHAVHPRRRGRGAVARSSTRSSRRGSKGEPPLPQYAAGSAGPEEADELLEPGHQWRAI